MKNYRQLRLFAQIMILTLITTVIFAGMFLFYSKRTRELYETSSINYTNEIIYQLEQTIASNYDSLSKILQFVTFHADIQNFLSEKDEDIKYRYYRQMNSNLPSIMSLNSHIINIIIRDNNDNLYSIIDNNYELYDDKDDTSASDLSPLLYNSKTNCHYFVLHDPIYSIIMNSFENQKLGDAYFILSDTAFLDQNNPNYNKTSSEIYLMDRKNQIFWNNSKEDESRLNILDRSDIHTKVEESTGLVIVSVIKQEEFIYNILGVLNSYQPVLFFIIILLLILWVLLILNIVSPLYQLFYFISKIKQGDLSTLKERVDLKGYREIEIISHETNGMLEQIDTLTNRLLTTNNHLYKTELQKKQAELNHLRSQINPHFLYNTLECIKGIAAEHKQTEIVDAAKSLATIFKYSIKGADKVPFTDELKIVKNYISIQKIRFGDHFTVEYDIEPECYEVIIPKMIIQPIVENAIVYGIEGTTRPSALMIKACSENNYLRIEVNNTGAPISAELLNKLQHDLALPLDISSNTVSSIGLFNVNERIKLSCGEKYGVYITSTPDGITSVLLTLPLDLI